MGILGERFFVSERYRSILILIFLFLTGNIFIQKPAYAGCRSGFCAKPFLRIALPVQNTVFIPGQDVLISGRAYGNILTTPNGQTATFRISYVEIYVDGQSVGRATLGPTRVSDNDVPYNDFSYTIVGGLNGLGSHTVAAKPVDNSSDAGSVEVVNVSIASNSSPTVQISSPKSDAIVTEGSSVLFAADARDVDGSVVSVQYFSTAYGGEAISPELTVPPYNFWWTAKSVPGLYAVVRDNLGATNRSPLIGLTVNDVPTANLLVSNINSTAPGSITLNVTAVDRVGGVSDISYFVNGTEYPAWYPYTYELKNIPAGNYTIYARVRDTYGLTANSASYNWSVTEPAGPPSVSITSGNASAVEPANFLLTANASASGGSISSVQWFANGQAISGPITVAPYSFSWNGVGQGSYSIVARALSSNGLSADSSPVSISVTRRSNQPPVVRLTEPKNGDVFTFNSPTPINLAASAADADGTISKVEFLVDGQLVATDTSAPFSAIWSATKAGSYLVQARTYDNSGESATSENARITVNDFTVSITSPASGQWYTPGSKVQVTAALKGTANTVARLEFYDNGTKFASLTSQPYTASLDNISSGPHTLLVKAFDANSKLLATSAEVKISAENSGPPSSSGSGFPGKSEGRLSVSNLGAAEYVMPIIVPPGTAGLVPQLSLQYSSSNGNGLLGMGWRLAGLSKIERCPRDYAHRDAAPGPVVLGMLDAFCIDGQRLVVRDEDVYGADGSEYRTEIDNYSRVISVGKIGGGPASFTVTLPDGTKLEYGTTSDSRLILSPYPTVASWSVSKVIDPRGNYYTVTYAQDAGAGEQIPVRVDYTGNGSQNLAPYNSVRFVYDRSRADRELTYLGGAKTSVLSRLSNVQTYAGNTLVKDYRLAYEVSSSSARSRLRSVTECADTGNTCIPPHIFDWENDGISFTGPVVNAPNPATVFGPLVSGNPYEFTSMRWADVNGDGIPDWCAVAGILHEPTDTYRYSEVFCMLSQPNGAAAKPVKMAQLGAENVFFFDFNGDGINDICSSTSCILNGPNGPTSNRVDAPGPFSVGQQKFWVDLAGSGKMDYCHLSNGGVKNAPYNLTCHRNLGLGFGPAINVGTFPFPSCSGSNCQTLQFDWASVSGDGTSSFCRIEGSSMRCRKWSISGLAAEVTSGDIDLGEKAGRAWVDVNGDGMADFCRVISDTPGQNLTSGHLACTLTTSKGFGETLVSPTIDIGANTGKRTWLDINLDGRVDYCRSVGSEARMECMLSTGTGFSGTVKLPDNSRKEIVDVNGDGKPDPCVYVTGGEISCYLAAGTLPDLMLGVRDGLGATVKVDYAPLSNPAVYKKGSGATYPDIELQNSTYVVRLVRRSNGVGGAMDTSYTYEGGRFNLEGRGFLGFSEINTYEPTGVMSRSIYMLNFPYIGLSKQTQVTNNGVVISDSVVSYEATLDPPYRIYPTLNVVKKNDLNGDFIGWVEVATPFDSYDQFGKALKIDIGYKTANGQPDGYSKTYVRNYQNDVTNWIIGSLTNEQLTSRVPGKPDSVRTNISTYNQINPGMGLVKQSIVEPSNGNQGVSNLRLVADYVYDGFGNLLSKAVSGANIEARTQIGLSYDVQGRGPVAVRNALNHERRFTFDWRFGVKATETDVNQLQTNWTYDPFGRQLTETRPDSTLLTVNYNICAGCVSGSAYAITRMETVIGSGAVVSPPARSYFDTLGRQIQHVRTGFMGQEVSNSTQYDALGRVGFESKNYAASGSGVQGTRYYYDALNRVYHKITPDNSTTSTTYKGLITIVTNDNNVAFKRTINSQGQLIKADDADGTGDASSLAYEYDNWGNVTKITDSHGNTTTVSYDLLGRRKELKDPDLGTRTYETDNLGQVLSQTDAKGQKTTFSYDLLGRLTRRLDPDQDSRWYFETSVAGSACGAKGKLCEATAANGYYRRYNYDRLGRLNAQLTRIDADYLVKWDYDAAGRVELQTYPTAFATPLAVRYNYNNFGLLQSVSNSQTGSAYWTRIAENVDGNLTAEVFGNGLVGTRDYDPITGRLVKVQAGIQANLGLVMDHAYHYDKLGRLDLRQDKTVGVGSEETFGYDALNRLRLSTFQATGTPLVTYNVAYNAIGNITSKTGVGTYSYPAAGSGLPHAVTAVSGVVNGISNPVYTYDGNGNMETDGARRVTWTSFDMPRTIEKSVQPGSPGAGNSTFVYGPELQRVKQTWMDNSKTLTTVYIGIDNSNFEKESNSQNNVTQFKHYVHADGRLVAIHTRRNDGTEDVRYPMQDRLQSTSVVTDEAGTIIERMAYDPWGDRQTANAPGTGSPDPLNAIQPSSTNRGFTGHEHLDQANVGLVHMNGRVYDPTLGRFLSADPIVSELSSARSYNRYSYVWNNPLNSTDPTGFEEQVQSVEVLERRLKKDKRGFSPECDNCSDPSLALIPNQIARQEREVAQQSQPSPQTPYRKTISCKSGSTSNTCSTKFGEIYQDGVQTWIAQAEDVIRSVEIEIPRPTEAEINFALNFVTVGSAGLSNALGKQGENSVRAIYKIGVKKGIIVNDRLRIPDGLDKTVLSEIKNVKYLSFTKQLRDFLDYSKLKGLQFDLYTRSGGQISAPLQQAIDAGYINHIYIP